MYNLFSFFQTALGSVRARDRSRDAGTGLLLWQKIHIQPAGALLLRQAALHDT